MQVDILFEPLRLGALTLPNRVVIPALTRMRAGPGGVPAPLNAQYYAQRASAGLNITEATAISVQGHGHPQMPGVHTAEQIAGRRLVTNAVRAKGGLIVLQIGRDGRQSHIDLSYGGGRCCTDRPEVWLALPRDRVSSSERRLAWRYGSCG